MPRRESLLRGNADMPAGELKDGVKEVPRDGIEPEDLWGLARELSYRVDISLASGYRDGSYDAVFRSAQVHDLPALSWGSDDVQKPWSAYANNPLQEKLGRRMAPMLRDFLKQKLPLYMVPSSITLLANVPLTPAGKVDRQSLPAPELSERVSDGAYVAPRTPRGAGSRRIWADILGLTRVGIHNNFFELGGHSLKATQVVSRIHRELGIQVPLRDLFSHPTIAELAPKLASAQPTAFAAIPRAPEAAHYPLSHAQRRLWVLSQLDGGVRGLQHAHRTAAGRAARTQMRFGRPTPASSNVMSRCARCLSSWTMRPDSASSHPPARHFDMVDLTGEPHPEDRARELALADAVTPFDLEHEPGARLVAVAREATLRAAAQHAPHRLGRLQPQRLCVGARRTLFGILCRVPEQFCRR